MGKHQYGWRDAANEIDWRLAAIILAAMLLCASCEGRIRCHVESTAPPESAS